MSNIYFFSGPCGCGKTTLAKAYAKHLVNNENKKSMIYLIHGDSFHAGFIESDHKEAFFVDGQASNPLLWEDILNFNWKCILNVAQMALEKGLDVVIDYVIEDELPLVQKLADEYEANLYYVVLTASQDTLKQRISMRGDLDLLERALFLKDKLDHLPENQGHLFDNTGKTIEQELQQLDMNIEQFILLGKKHLDNFQNYRGAL